MTEKLCTKLGNSLKQSEVYDQERVIMARVRQFWNPFFMETSYHQLILLGRSQVLFKV